QRLKASQDSIMDAFVSRKKRKLSPSVEPASPPDNDDDEDEPTDVKLAMLSSLHPSIDQDALLDILLAHEGSVSAASGSLRNQTPSPKKRCNGIGSQTSLRHFASRTPETGASSRSPLKTRPKLLSKKGVTLHLYDPEQIAEHTPCTIIHNFLPPEDADNLLRELLEESRSFERATFKLFDNVVSSPHTSSFYVETMDDLHRQKFDYIYNGSRLTVSAGAPLAPLTDTSGWEAPS
ncbi:MAG: hypothetical protein OK454_09630, partial [Thaumarchaeota archaeon]|nr:hypothetical protein [Nitrososphaerota archaeon]